MNNIVFTKKIIFKDKNDKNLYSTDLNIVTAR